MQTTKQSKSSDSPDSQTSTPSSTTPLPNTQRILLVRSQLNTINLMQIEARLQAARVVERCCGFFYLEGMSRCDSLAACAKRPPLLLLHEGRDYHDLLTKMDDAEKEKVNERFADGVVEADHNDEDNFTLEYEQSQRVSELEQIPFTAGVRTACWFVQQVSMRLRKRNNWKNKKLGWRERAHKTFVIIDYKDFVCLTEEMHYEEEHQEILEQPQWRQTSLFAGPPRGMFWDRFFQRWSRGGKPWNFSSSLDPFVAQASLNLMIYAFGRLRRGKLLPLTWADTVTKALAKLEVMTHGGGRGGGGGSGRGGGTSSSGKRGKGREFKFGVPQVNHVHQIHPSEEQTVEVEQEEGWKEELLHDTIHPPPRLIDCCCGSGTITAVASVSQRFKSITSCDIQKDFLLHAKNNLDFLFEDPEFSSLCFSSKVQFQQMDWRCFEKKEGKVEKLVEGQENVLVIANTPWGKRCGHGEGYNEEVVRGILRKVPAKATLFGFLIPPKTIPVCHELLNLHLIVRIGKPAVFVIGTRKI